MTDREYHEIRTNYAAAGEVDRPLVEELRATASRLVRFSALPPAYAPYGVWNSEAEEEIFQSWMTDRLIAGGQLQALLDRASNLASFRRLAERSLRQHVLNQRARSQAQNLYHRTRETLEGDVDFHEFRGAARPQDVWWGLSDWREEPRAEFPGGDDELAARAWALGEFEIVRYRPDARKLSHVLAKPELKRFLVGMFERVEALLTLSRITRAMQQRFQLDEPVLEALDETGEEELVTADEPDPLVLEQTAMAVIAEMSSRQVEVLVSMDADETIDQMAEHLECSVGTVVNEQRRIGAILDRNSEDEEQRGIMLRKVLDLLHEEGERR